MLGFKGKAGLGAKKESMFDNSKFKKLKAQVLKKRTWIEIKFQEETPSCRTFHAQASYNERLIIYGGTDINKDDAQPNELWMIEPLLNQKPRWYKIHIDDEALLRLPDGIKRHQMVVRKVADRVHLLIIGGSRSF